MKRCGWALLLCCLPVVAGGCDSGKPSSQPGSTFVRTEDFVGKWRLVRAGGQAPAALNIKSLQIDIAADGTWTSDIQMEGQFAGMSVKGGGKWSLAGGIVSYSNGANSGKSQARLESGRLILDPDFSVRKGGTEEVVGEYER